MTRRHRLHATLATSALALADVRRDRLGATTVAAAAETGHAAAGPADIAELQAGHRRPAQAAGRRRLADVPPHL